MSTIIALLDRKRLGCYLAAMQLTPEQCRAARGWIGWTQQELATQAGLGLSTLRAFEAGTRSLMRNNEDALRRAIEAAGVELRFEEGKAVGIDGRNVPPSGKGPSVAEGDASAP